MKLRGARLAALVAGLLALPALVPRAPARAQTPSAAGPPAFAASTEDRVRHGQRMDALERELAALRERVQRNDAAAARLRQEVRQAQARDTAEPLVLGLLAVTLLAAGAAAYVWPRRKKMVPGPTWRELSPAPDSAPGPPAAALPPRSGSRTSSADDALDSQLSVSFPSSFTDSSTLRVATAEELHGLEQQVEFFLSIGQAESAVHILASHIDASPGTSALAWLDLLRILHGLGRREDFEARRRAFHRSFNARLPSFDDYSEDAGPGLEQYEAAMSRIVTLWPSRKVLEVIRESVFRPPERLDGPAFSLAAYRDLLLLYHVCQLVLSIEEDLEARPQHGAGDHTGLQPLPMVFPSIAADLGGSSLAAELAPDLDLRSDAAGHAGPQGEPVTRGELEALERTLALNTTRAARRADFELP